MSIPDSPWVFQVAWDPAPAVLSLWDHAYTNYLACLQQVSVTRAVVHASAPPDTMQLTALDPEGIVKPLKESSPLWPNVKRDRQCRLLARKPDMSFMCVLFGYLTNIAPDSSNRTKPKVTLDVESAWTRLAKMRVNVPLVQSARVYDPEVPVFSALTTLLEAARLQLGGAHTVVDEVGQVQVGGSWGGGEMVFGDALADLANRAGAITYVEYLIPVADTDPAWRLHWAHPSAGAPAFSWDWTAGDLEQKPVLKYTTEARS